jgi:MFS family permease
MKGKVRILVAMFFMQFILGSSGAIPSPLLAIIGASLNITNNTLLQMIVSIPTLVMIPTNLLSGALGAKMSKKSLFLIGAILFIIGGIGPVFTTSITIFLVYRVVLGLGLGFVFPLGFAMLPDYFEGQARQTASGIFNAGSLLLAIPAALIAGIIGSSAWQNAFWLYAFTIVPIILVMTLIPAVKKPAGEGTSNHPAEKAAPPHSSTYVTAFVGMVFYIGVTVMSLTISFFMATKMPVEQAGGIAGFGTALFSVGGIIASLLYGKLISKMGKWLGVFAFILGAAGYLLVFLFPSPVVALIAFTCCGINIGMAGPVMIMGAMAKSSWSASLTTAIIMVGLNLGQFISPYAIGLFSAIGNGSWPIVYLCSAILIAFVAVYYLVDAIKPERGEVK